MSKRNQQIQNGLPTLESEVALQDFEAAVSAGNQAGGKKKGRPKGAANHDVEQAEAPASRCPRCNSTRRAKYFNRRDLQISGVDPKTGKPYTSIIIRRTQCDDCGQHRDDRQLVNEPA